jgi:acetyltransferase-like isoleucine patch superfamily enzyme
MRSPGPDQHGGTVRDVFARVVQSVMRPFCVSGAVSVGHGLHLGLGSKIWSAHGLSIGAGVYVGRYCTIEADGEIGDNVLIANNVGIVGRVDHDIHDIGSPITQSTWVGDADRQARVQDRVLIESDVWLGFGAIVLGGVSIGRGAIVGAGAVVTRDVAPYAIVVGNPAAAVGERFSPCEIAEHEARLPSARGRAIG